MGDIAVVIRQARPADAEGMAQVVDVLHRAGLRRRGGTADDMQAHYLAHPDQLSCLLAVGDTGRVLGFQSLKRASDGNVYGTPVGWGIIGTHILPEAGRQGIGRRFFAETARLAKRAGLTTIEAGIGADNSGGLGYYAAMGLYSYRERPGIDFKRCVLGERA